MSKTLSSPQQSSEHHEDIIFEKTFLTSGRGVEAFFPALKDELLPQLLRSKESLPPEIREVVQTIEYRQKDLLGQMPNDRETIRARRQIIFMIMDALERNYEKLPEKVRVIASVMLSIRRQLKTVMNTIMDDDRVDGNKPDPETVAFFERELLQIIERIKDEEQFDPLRMRKGSHFPRIPEHIKLKLLFPPFEAIAEKQGVLPIEAMDSRKNRVAIAHALSKITGLNVKSCKSFYSNVAAGQRESQGGKKNQGISLWRKYELLTYGGEEDGA